MTRLLMQPFRTVLPDGSPDPQRSARCSLPGCERSTKHRKPYCSKHVEEHDYVACLVQTLEETEREQKAVAKRGARAVRVHGVTCTEILSQLYQYGGRSVERLSRDLQLPAEVVQSYANKLARAGLVGLGSSARKNVILQPTNKRLSAPHVSQGNESAA